MESVNYFRAIHGAIDSNSAQETLRREVRKDRTEDYATSIGYVPDAKRNGEVQPIVAKTTNAANRYNIIAMPGDPLAVGDILEFYGEHWIVVDIKSVDVVSLIGIAMQCNHMFRWQNWTPDIIYRWGVLDSGVYSTTLEQEQRVMFPDKQYKIYLPFDKESEKIYLGKRIATERTYDKNGDRVLVCYEVTGIDSISESYGKGGHLLMLNVRSGADYKPNVDNLDLMICDYIAPEEEEEPEVKPPNTLLTCSISGRDTLKAGIGLRKYAVSFYLNDGETEDTSVVAVWDVIAPEGYEGAVNFTVDGNSLLISASEDAIGETVILRVVDDSGLYAPCEMKVEVVKFI